MKPNSILRVLVALAASSSALGLYALEPGRPDPRTRTFLPPARVVWTSGDAVYGNRSVVKNAESLLLPRHGQIPEERWRGVCGCAMENNGEPASVILDFGRELHGGLQIGSMCTRGMKMRVRFGESVGEVMSDIGTKSASNDHAIRDGVHDIPFMGIVEIGNTGFRFVRLDLVTAGKVNLECVRAVSLMRPMPRLGEFRCSDERLNRIFDTAVRTVHLCCQDYLWDGIKRDRLVWMGDTHPETLVILPVFGAASVLPASLDYMAATTSPSEWMNGMPTYTLWWIRNLAEWYRYTGDLKYLQKHAAYLEKTFDHVLTRMGPDGWLGEGAMGSFLDWPTHGNPEAERAGTQGLALLTARETEMMAKALGLEALAKNAQEMAESITVGKVKSLPKSAAAMLALSGLAEPKEMFEKSLGREGHAGVSTFYGYYMIEAISAAGEQQRALDTVRDYWGGMLDVGATSFWEDFDLAWTNNCFRIDELPVPSKTDIHGDYGKYCYKGFRHSLCHGWAAGPAAWCFRRVLGIEILEPGCKRLRINPALGDLDWAEGAMALPTGEAIKVRVHRSQSGAPTVEVEKPDWVVVAPL